MEKQKWITQAMIYAKNAVEINFAGRFWRNEEKRKWVETDKDAWYLDGTPPKGMVMIDNDLPSVFATNMGGHIIIEFKYPDNSKKKYEKWYHDYYKKEDLDNEVSEMIQSKTSTEEIVSMVIDTIFSDIENNPNTKINELRKEWVNHYH